MLGYKNMTKWCVCVLLVTVWRGSVSSLALPSQHSWHSEGTMWPSSTTAMGSTNVKLDLSQVDSLTRLRPSVDHFARLPTGETRYHTSLPEKFLPSGEPVVLYTYLPGDSKIGLTSTSEEGASDDIVIPLSPQTEKALSEDLEFTQRRRQRAGRVGKLLTSTPDAGSEASASPVGLSRAARSTSRTSSRKRRILDLPLLACPGVCEVIVNNRCVVNFTCLSKVTLYYA